MGKGCTLQNPLVGCIIVRNDEIISEGYHKHFGGAHAEVNAITGISPKYRNLISESTLFVSLEPCNHTGKTPPCTELILKTKIPSVVIRSRDPNPNVKGGGLARLARAGVNVQVLEENPIDHKKLLRPFKINVLFNRPYIILKWAESKDGFIGKPGDRVKITEALTDRLVHKWRGESDAIMVGTNTAIIDNPQLTNRHYSGKNPIRVVVDRYLKIPHDSHLYDGTIPTLVFTEKPPPKVDFTNLEFIECSLKTDELKNILKTLYNRGIGTLLVEGGAQLLTSFLSEGLWDECRVIRSPGYLNNGILSPQISLDPDIRFTLRDDRILIWENKGQVE